MKKTIAIILSVLTVVSVLSVGFFAFSSDPSEQDYEYSLNADESVTITAYKGIKYDVSIPETLDGHTVSKIAKNAFAATAINSKDYKSADMIRTITVPKTVTSCADVFKSLPFLKRIDVDSKNPSYSSKNGVLFNKDKTVLISYPKSRMDYQYVIPSTVKTVESYAFSGARFLVSVKIPSSVKTVKAYAFFDCAELENVYVPETVTKIGEFAFGYKSRYLTSYSDEFSADFVNDPKYTQDYEYFDGEKNTVNGFVVYGEKGSAAEKYCKKNYSNQADRKDLKDKFKTVNKKAPTVKVKADKNRTVKVTLPWYENADEYDINIYKGDKLANEHKTTADESYKKDNSFVVSYKKFKNGTYTVKARAVIKIGGYKFKTPWSKKVKFTVK